MQATKRLTTWRITITRNLVDRRWLQARISRAWFDVAERASESRLVAEAWIDVSGMNENEALAAALRDLASSLDGRLL